ncbi:MAG: hypothetical protein ACYS3S_25495 [Planctomycetota bacterium]
MRAGRKQSQFKACPERGRMGQWLDFGALGACTRSLGYISGAYS